MPITSHTFSRFAMTAAACALLAACYGAGPETAMRQQAEAYIRSNIATLSPRSASAGSKFSVSKIEWQDDNTALVTYQDGSITLRGTTDVTIGSGSTVAARIRLINENASSSSTTSDSSSSKMMSSSTPDSTSSSTSSAMSSATSSSSMNGGIQARGEGEFCGGIAAIPCQSGLECKLEGSYPDAGGTCVKV